MTRVPRYVWIPFLENIFIFIKWSKSSIMKIILQWCVRLKFSVSSTGQALDQAQDHVSEVISFEGGDKFLTADPTPNRMDCQGHSAVLH